MRLRIRHLTRYRYDRPVALGAHVFRMHPRLDGAFAVEEFSMAVHPKPSGLRGVRDAFGNLRHEAWFEGETQEMRIAFRWQGRTLPRPGAGDFKAGAALLPPSYGVRAASLKDCLGPGLVATAPPVSDFAAEAAEEAGRSTLPFLRILHRRIRERLRQAPRLLGGPLDPAATLAAGQGSCRDLAVLFMACCRAEGVAARFVSGYLPAGEGERQHMHAWAEALLPGAGWLAFDPSRDEPVGERHVAVAAAADPGDAAPVSGCFSGNDVRSEMDVELTVETEQP